MGKSRKRKRKESSSEDSSVSEVSSSDQYSSSYKDSSSDSSDCDEPNKPKIKKRKIENEKLKLELVKNLNRRLLFSISLFWVGYCGRAEKRKKENKFQSYSLKKLVKKVFSDGNPDSRSSFPRYFADKLKKAKAASLTKIVKVNFKNKSEKPPRLKSEMIDWIICTLFKIKPSKEKRKFEMSNINDMENSIFVRILTHDIPEEIMMLILSFCSHGRLFLDSFGLVNSNCYLLCLKSWDSIKIRKENVYKIPLLVLRCSRSVFFNCSSKVYQKEYKYVQENILNRVNYLCLSGNVTSFLWSLKKNKFVLKNCRKLKITCKKEFVLYESFPKLKILLFSHLSKPKKCETILNLDDIKIFYQSMPSYRNYSKWEVGLVIPDYFEEKTMKVKKLVIENTEVYYHSYVFKVKTWETISKMSSLENLTLKIEKEDDLNYISKLVYPNLKNLRFLCLIMTNLLTAGRYFSSKSDVNVIGGNAFQKLFLLEKLEYVEMKFRVQTFCNYKWIESTKQKTPKILNCSLIYSHRSKLLESIEFQSMLNLKSLRENVETLRYLKNFKLLKITLYLRINEDNNNEIVKNGLSDFKAKTDELFKDFPCEINWKSLQWNVMGGIFF